MQSSRASRIDAALSATARQGGMKKNSGYNTFRTIFGEKSFRRSDTWHPTSIWSFPGLSDRWESIGRRPHVARRAGACARHGLEHRSAGARHRCCCRPVEILRLGAAQPLAPVRAMCALRQPHASRSKRVESTVGASTRFLCAACGGRRRNRRRRPRRRSERRREADRDPHDLQVDEAEPSAMQPQLLCLRRACGNELPHVHDACLHGVRGACFATGDATGECARCSDVSRACAEGISFCFLRVKSCHISWE